MLPMHMPGHKRNPSFAGDAFRSDITEIDGFDDLHAPQGLIRDIEKNAREIWQAKEAFISVNGSTALIESAICSLGNRGGKFLFSSDSHISVWHGSEIAGLTPVPCPLKTSDGIPFFSGTNEDAAVSLLQNDPDIKLALITTPTYEGVITDTSRIKKLMNGRGGFLIADCSHGAHLGLDPYFPERPDADIVIMSTHKTLHSPTQTAVAAVYSERIEIGRIRHFLSIFESSSPSYVLMGGICRALLDIRRSGKSLFSSWTEGLKEARERLSGLTNLSLWDGGSFSDPSKLVILTNGCINGGELAQILRRQYRIEIEASFEDHIIAMTGIGDTPPTLLRFCDAMEKIDSSLAVTSKKEIAAPCIITEPPVFMLPLEDALSRESTAVPYKDAAGKISAEYIFPYPPGIPAIVPGQLITDSIVRYLIKSGSSGIRLRVDPLRDPDGMIKICR